MPASNETSLNGRMIQRWKERKKERKEKSIRSFGKDGRVFTRVTKRKSLNLSLQSLFVISSFLSRRILLLTFLVLEFG